MIKHECAVKKKKNLKLLPKNIDCPLKSSFSCASDELCAGGVAGE